MNKQTELGVSFISLFSLHIIKSTEKYRRMHNDDEQVSKGTLARKTALLDAFCKIDIVEEIQSDNRIVIDIFDDIFTINALFEIVHLNVVEHSGVKLLFPQICADVFTCLPDRFIDDICANDFLMDSFFKIPEGEINSRKASCFCQMVERFVTSVPDVMYTYLQLRVDVVLDLLLQRISLSSYLNSLRYLLDIPAYETVCWWGDSSVFVSKIYSVLEKEVTSTNAKELILSIIQRATVFNKQETTRSSKHLLESLMLESNFQRLFSTLETNMHHVCNNYSSLRSADAVDGLSYTQQSINSSMEIANNCFLILSRFFWKYAYGSSAGRGGYNASFNALPLSIEEAAELGAIDDEVALRRLSRLCKNHLGTLMNDIRTIVKLHLEICERCEKQGADCAVFRMPPKVVLGFCEFFYHYVYNRNNSKLFLYLIKNKFIDSVLWLMQAYSSVTYIHINIVDVLISIVYSNDRAVLTALFEDTRVLQVVYEAISIRSLSPLKSQLNIFLQAIASCSQHNRLHSSEADTLETYSDDDLSRRKVRDDRSVLSSSILSLLMKYPYFRDIIEVVDIFHIYEPLANIGMETVDSLHCLKKQT